jgi:flagellar motor switch protein FliG
VAKEEALLERWRELAPEQQQQVFDYMQAIQSHQLAAHLKNLLLDMIERDIPTIQPRSPRCVKSIEAILDNAFDRSLKFKKMYEGGIDILVAGMILCT